MRAQAQSERPRSRPRRAATQACQQRATWNKHFDLNKAPKVWQAAQSSGAGREDAHDRTNSTTAMARSRKAPYTGKLSKRPDSTWAGLSSSQESLRRSLPRHCRGRGFRKPDWTPGMRFLRQAESFGPMGSQNQNHLHLGGAAPPPVGRRPSPSKRTRREERAPLIVHDEFRPAIP